jgi:hypothetical protein
MALDTPTYDDVFPLFPFSEPVTFFLQTATGPPPTTGGVTVQNALREIVKKEMKGPGGALLKQELVNWHLPDAQLAGNEPTYGIVVKAADGKRYTISESLGPIRFDHQVFKVWVLPCRKEV